MENPCECGIEPPGSISHGVSISAAFIVFCAAHVVFMLMPAYFGMCFRHVWVKAMSHIGLWQFPHSKIIPEASACCRTELCSGAEVIVCFGIVIDGI